MRSSADVSRPDTSRPRPKSAAVRSSADVSRPDTSKPRPKSAATVRGSLQGFGKWVSAVQPVGAHYLDCDTDGLDSLIKVRQRSRDKGKYLSTCAMRGNSQGLERSNQLRDTRLEEL